MLPNLSLNQNLTNTPRSLICTNSSFDEMHFTAANLSFNWHQTMRNSRQNNVIISPDCEQENLHWLVANNCPKQNCFGYRIAENQQRNSRYLSTETAGNSVSKQQQNEPGIAANSSTKTAVNWSLTGWQLIDGELQWTPMHVGGTQAEGTRVRRRASTLGGKFSNSLIFL